MECPIPCQCDSESDYQLSNYNVYKLIINVREILNQFFQQTGANRFQYNSSGDYRDLRALIGLKLKPPRVR